MMKKKLLVSAFLLLGTSVKGMEKETPVYNEEVGTKRMRSDEFSAEPPPVHQCAAQLLLLDSDNLEMREKGLQDCLFFVRHLKNPSQSRLKVAQALFDRTDTIEAGIEALWGIVQDGADIIRTRLTMFGRPADNDGLIRLEAANILFLSKEQRIKEQGIDALLSIAKNPDLFPGIRPQAANLLFKDENPDIKKKGAEAFLYIAKNLSISSQESLEAADTLFADLDNAIKERGIEAYFSIAQFLTKSESDLNVRLKAVNVLLTSETDDIRESGCKAYISVIESINTNNTFHVCWTFIKPFLERDVFNTNILEDICEALMKKGGGLEVSKVLWDHPKQEIKRKGAEFYVDFLQKNRTISFKERVKIAEMLYNHPDSYIKERGVHAYFAIAQNPEFQISQYEFQISQYKSVFKLLFSDSFFDKLTPSQQEQLPSLWKTRTRKENPSLGNFINSCREFRDHINDNLKTENKDIEEFKEFLLKCIQENEDICNLNNTDPLLTEKVKNACKILGLVLKDTKEQDFKKAYKAKALKAHDDKGGTGIKELNNAKEALECYYFYEKMTNLQREMFKNAMMKLGVNNPLTAIQDAHRKNPNSGLEISVYKGLEGILEII